MTLSPNNVFQRLHKWAARQDENFLTESLAVVLEQLLVLAPAVGTRLVSQLTGGFVDVSADNPSTIAIRTQVETGVGRPDLEICTSDRLVWIEVKAESALRTGQLEGYRVLLEESGFEQTRLVLLTRYREVLSQEDENPDLEIKWFEFADWLENEIAAAEAAGPVAGFLAQQFLDFLGARGMTLAQVGKYMPEGVRALSNLMNMLFEAASACKVPVKPKVWWWEGGVGKYLDGGKYEVSVGFTEPGKLWFGTRSRIDPEAARKLGVGELEEADKVVGGYHWWRGVELDSEDVYFFARSKVSQMRWLENFLQECLSMAHSIETPDQPPILEEPEGN